MASVVKYARIAGRPGGDVSADRMPDRPASSKQCRDDLYEIETDGNTAPHVVTYRADGQLAETEVQIPVAQLSVAVQDAVKKASPAGTIKGAEIVQKGGQAVIEVEVVEGKKIVEYKFDVSGRLLKTEVK